MNDELIGTYLGQYHLREIIGRGGMATVYKAYQISLDRFVAIKLIHSPDPFFVARFKREARLIGRLQHPNILTVYDHGEQDGRLYLVLQYIENGSTLTELLGQPISPAQALRLIGHVLDGLDYAHARGIVHRDIKPSNILMASPRWPMLADFGIAKLVNDSQLFTQPGMVMGTAAYMAPEMAFGRPADARTDIYAVGIVLYEMLTGRVPFDADTPVAMLHQQAYEAPPPPRSLNPNLPEALEAVLLQALAKKPEQRYQTAAEMSAALEQAASQQSQPTPKSNRLTDLYQSGIQAFEAADWDRAIERLSRLVKLDATNDDAADLLAAAREAQARPPNQIANLYQAGMVAFQQEHWDEAVDVLGRLLKLDPSYKDAASLLETAQKARSHASHLAGATGSLEKNDSPSSQNTPNAKATTTTTSDHAIQATASAGNIRSYLTAAVAQTTMSLKRNRTASVPHALHCPNCRQAIQPEWRVCPYCSHEIGQRNTEGALTSSIAAPPLDDPQTSAPKSRWLIWAVSLVAIALFGGAGWAWRGRSQINSPINSGSIAGIATAAPTNTARPTGTPTPTGTPQPTNTPRPTDTPTPTDTPRPTNTARPTDTPRPPDALVRNAQQRLRSGPGQNYANLGAYTQNTALKVTGKDSTGSWVQVTAPDGQVGWMRASDLQINLVLADLVIVEAPPTPTAPPTAKPAPKPISKPTPEPATAAPPTPEPATAAPPTPEPPTPEPPTPTRKPRPKSTPTPIP